MMAPTVEELRDFWEERAENIAQDYYGSLDYKEKYYTFIEAYTTYLFYKNAVEEYEEEAREEAIKYGLDFE